MMQFEQLQSLVTRCTASGGPLLYRSLYNMSTDAPRTVSSWKDWHALPFLDKDFLIQTPFTERIWEQYSDIDHLRVSSGTSGKPPLFSPRTYLRGMDYRMKYHDFKKPILAFGVPAMPHWHEHFQTEHGLQPNSILFDPKNADTSIRLMHATGADSISVFAFHMPIIGAAVEKEGIGDQVRFIEIAGEACSRTLFEYMQRVFPNATIIPFYGASEVEDSPIGAPCRAITGEDPLALYHAKESQYHELIDPQSGAHVPICKDAEGELVISAYPGTPTVFPLIRFRTGDMVRVVDESCSEHGTWSFTIIGRVATDFLKVPGGVLRADETERVLQLFRDRVTDRFELHRIENATEEGPKIAVTIYVEPRNNDVDLKMLARDIASQLRVNPERTYEKGVHDGLYLPLECKPLEKNTLTVKKQKRMIAN